MKEKSTIFIELIDMMGLEVHDLSKVINFLEKIENTSELSEKRKKEHFMSLLYDFKKIQDQNLECAGELMSIVNTTVAKQLVNARFGIQEESTKNKKYRPSRPMVAKWYELLRKIHAGELKKELLLSEVATALRTVANGSNIVTGPLQKFAENGLNLSVELKVTKLHSKLYPIKVVFNNPLEDALKIHQAAQEWYPDLLPRIEQPVAIKQQEKKPEVERKSETPVVTPKPASQAPQQKTNSLQNIARILSGDVEKPVAKPKEKEQQVSRLEGWQARKAIFYAGLFIDKYGENTVEEVTRVLNEEMNLGFKISYAQLVQEVRKQPNIFKIKGNVINLTPGFNRELFRKSFWPITSQSVPATRCLLNMTLQEIRAIFPDTVLVYQIPGSTYAIYDIRMDNSAMDKEKCLALFCSFRGGEQFFDTRFQAIMVSKKEKQNKLLQENSEFGLMSELEEFLVQITENEN